MVEGKFMKLQVDYGLECGSGEKVHFRNSPKRSRERILNRADERNSWSVKECQKDLTKVKKQKTKEKDAYILYNEASADCGSGDVIYAKYQYCL